MGSSAGQHRGRLLGVRSASDAKRVVGLRQAELAEEDTGQRFVVVLPGVDEDLLVPRPQFRRERRGLDELGSRPDHADGSAP